MIYKKIELCMKIDDWMLEHLWASLVDDLTIGKSCAFPTIRAYVLFDKTSYNALYIYIYIYIILLALSLFFF